MNNDNLTDSPEPKRTLAQWLFNPFQFIAGFFALALGMLAILLMAWLGGVSGIHYDGVLDIHAGLTGKLYPIWIFIAEGLINWIAMCVVLSIFGLIFSRQKFRVIDLLGTQALARWPYLFAALATMPAGFQRDSQHMLSKYTNAGGEVVVQSSDVLFFAFGLLVILLTLIWMVWLMYKAYAVSCNLKGGKAIGSFIAGLIIAEVASKLLLWFIYDRFGFI